MAAYTLSALETLLANRWEGVPFWTTEEARLALNEALRMWNLLTGIFKGQAVVLTTPNTVYYTTPAPLLYPTRVQFNGQPLTFSSIFELDYAVGNWEGQTTASGGDVPPMVKTWVPLGFTRFAIWPADATGTNSLLINGIEPAPILVNLADSCPLNQSEANTLVGYALHLAAFKLGGQTFTQTQDLAAAFYKAALAQNARLRATNLFKNVMGQDWARAEVPMRQPEEAEQAVSS